MSHSYSKINTYAECPAEYRYKYILDMQLKRKNPNFFRGIAAHDILRDWFLDQRGRGHVFGDSDLFVDQWVRNYLATVGEIEFTDQLFDVTKEVEQMGEYVKGFLRLKVFDDWEILHVEEEFVVEIDNQQVTFTPDLVARDPSGVVWVTDHKTSDKQMDRDALDMRPQALLYFVGVSQFYNVGGFIFNYIRKKMPTKPRLNKTGKKAVTDLNRIDTTYEMLYEFVKENDLLDDMAHRRRLAELRDKGNTFYFQHPFYITSDMAEESLKDTAQRINLMRYSIKNDYWPRTIQPLNGCKRCEFFSICTTELTGGNTELVLQWYEPRDEKNPYERDGADL